MSSDVVIQTTDFVQDQKTKLQHKWTSGQTNELQGGPEQIINKAGLRRRMSCVAEIERHRRTERIWIAEEIK